MGVGDVINHYRTIEPLTLPSFPDPLPQPFPPGMTPGVWQYVHFEEIAEQYDSYFSQNSLFDFDSQVLAKHITPPGVVVDLGCGTGRSLIPLARRGLHVVGVDLSMPMLRIAGEKALREGVSIGRIQANLVDLDCLASESADYCISMFSTIGMIRGRVNRHRALAHAHRILKPGGLLVLHVHNLWYAARERRGAYRLAGHLAASLFCRGLERGDRYFSYRGIPRMFLHTFTQRELVKALRQAGFEVEELIPLAATRRRRLGAAWFFGGLRANGWIVVCRK